MENFYIVLICKNGDVIHNTFATSHDDLIDKYIINKISNIDFFRAKFKPKDSHSLNSVNDYKLIIKETYIPEWFTNEFREIIISKLKDIITLMIVSTYKNIILDEGVILTNGAIINEVKNSIVFGMYNTAHIKLLECNSEVKIMCDDTIIDKIMDNAKVNDMDNNSIVHEMHDYSKILNMYGTTKVSKMFDNSHIGMLKGHSTIEQMENEAEALRLKHMSKVDEMYGHSVIEEMWDWSTIGKMFDSAQIRYMDDDTKVLEMHDNSMIFEMTGNSIVEQLYENSLVGKLDQMAKIIQKQIDDNQ